MYTIYHVHFGKDGPTSEDGPTSQLAPLHLSCPVCRPLLVLPSGLSDIHNPLISLISAFLKALDKKKSSETKSPQKISLIKSINKKQSL